MDKASVVALRNSLSQNGDNRSVKIAFDNGIIISLASDIVLWNDDKEIVIAFTADSNSGAYEANKPISIIGSTYENIQFIIGNTNVKNLDSIIDSISNVTSVKDEDKKQIINWYKKVYSYKHELDTKSYNPIDIKRD